MRTAKIKTNVEFPRKKFMMTESGILTVDLGQRPEGTTLEDYLEEARLFALQIKLDREAHAKLMHEECTSSHEPYTPKDSAW